MKILFLTKPDHAEYQSDMTFHGLKSLGIDVVDYPRLWYMYYEDLNKPGYDPVGKVGGNGFTIFGTLPSDNNVDRTNIPEKIVNLYYDYVIFARADFSYDLEQLVLKTYPKNRIIWLDGHDVQMIFNHRLGSGIYFKRELVAEISGIHPISFAIPEEKILLYNEDKVKNISDIIPGQTTLGTYKYTKEEDYYREYSQSYFAVTMKKSGWDCVRHYEIIANGCVPIFFNIAHCPILTMTTLPKDKLLEIGNIIDKDRSVINFISNKDMYSYYVNTLTDHLKKYCTTKELAKYVLDTINKYK